MAWDRAPGCGYGPELYRAEGIQHADAGRDNQDVRPDCEGNDEAAASSKAADLMVLSALSGHAISRQRRI